MESVIPFSFLLNHLIVIPVDVNGEERKFIFDTGIGVTVITKRFAEYLNVKPDGTYTGKRMSGQDVSMQLTRLQRIRVGHVERSEFTVGIFDTSAFPSELNEISGILAPNYFEEVIFTVNFESSEILIRGDLDKLEELSEFVIPLDVEKLWPAITIFVSVILPSNRKTRLELDSGSDALILNSKFMDELNIDRKGTQIDILKGVDETGSEYVRYLTMLKGKITIAGAEEVFKTDPRVIFQDIIYDGLLGNEFLLNYNVTFDLKHGRMGFATFSEIYT